MAASSSISKARVGLSHLFQGLHLGTPASVHPRDGGGLPSRFGKPLSFTRHLEHEDIKTDREMAPTMALPRSIPFSLDAIDTAFSGIAMRPGVPDLTELMSLCPSTHGRVTGSVPLHYGPPLEIVREGKEEKRTAEPAPLPAFPLWAETKEDPIPAVGSAHAVYEDERGGPVPLHPFSEDSLRPPHSGLAVQNFLFDPMVVSSFQEDKDGFRGRAYLTPPPSPLSRNRRGSFATTGGPTGESDHETEAGSSTGSLRSFHHREQSPPRLRRSTFGMEIDQSPSRSVTPDRARTPHSTPTSSPPCLRSQSMPRTPERRGVRVRLNFDDSPSDREAAPFTPPRKAHAACPDAPLRGPRPAGAGIGMVGPAVTLNFSPYRGQH